MSAAVMEPADWLSHRRSRCCVGVKHLTDLHVLGLFTSCLFASGIPHDDFICGGIRCRCKAPWKENGETSIHLLDTDF